MLIRSLRLLPSLTRIINPYSKQATAEFSKKEPRVRQGPSPWFFFKDYFDNSKKQVEQECEAVIRQMLKAESLEIYRVTRMINGYLRSHGQQLYQDNNRTPEGLIRLLTAIHLRREPKLDQYRNKVVELLNRIDITKMELEGQQLVALISSWEDFRKLPFEKIKSDVLRSKLVMLLRDNFAQVPTAIYFRVVSLLEREYKNAGLMLGLADCLFSSLSEYFRLKVEGGELDKKWDSMSRFISSGNIPRLANVYNIYGVSQSQHAVSFCDYLLKVYLPTRLASQIPQSFIRECGTLYRGFPPHFLHPSTQKQLKSMLLDAIIQSASSSPKHKAQLFEAGGSFFASSILNHFFCKHAHSLPYREAGPFKYLTKEQTAVPPELPSIFWELYSHNPERQHKNAFFKDTIKNIYPDRYVDTSEVEKHHLTPFQETEVKVRVDLALDILGVKVKGRQMEVGGRYLDYVLEDDILLEIDGKFHLSLRHLENSMVNDFRNMHLVLAGHRLITINIYEYNLRRDAHSLAELIRDKLAIVREAEAVLVV